MCDYMLLLEAMQAQMIDSAIKLYSFVPPRLQSEARHLPNGMEPSSAKLGLFLQAFYSIPV